jgi:catechol 2,3-dioxygenase-like lactoylglutathione lyase family enzyme
MVSAISHTKWTPFELNMEEDMILAFAHPGMVVPDLDKAIEFYSKMFGFKVIGHESWQDSEAYDQAIGLKGSAAKGVMMAGHNCHIEIFEYSAPKPTVAPPETFLAHETGIRHIAFYVDDPQKELDRLVSLGGSALGCLPEGGGAVYARDPFGNMIELCKIPSPEESPENLPGVKKLGNFEG